MSNVLYGPDGRPMRAAQQPVAQEFKAALGQLHDRQNAAFQQLIHLGIFVEYLAQRIESTGVDLLMEDFPAFAEAKYKEVQAKTIAALKEQGRVIPQEEVDGRDVAEIAGIDLDDDRTVA